MTVEPVQTNQPAPELTRRFYETALSVAERADFPSALKVTGLDEEIAVLRLRLRSALRERPEDLALLFKGVELLVKVVAAHYRLPRQSAEEFQAAIERVLASMGVDGSAEDAVDA